MQLGYMIMLAGTHTYNYGTYQSVADVMKVRLGRSKWAELAHEKTAFLNFEASFKRTFKQGSSQQTRGYLMVYSEAKSHWRDYLSLGF